MAEFKRKCCAREITLWLHLPHYPKFNDTVERRTGTYRYEFRGCWGTSDDLAEANRLIGAVANALNRIKSCHSLGYRTLKQFLKKVS